jgi:2-hydroxychromene-2-carboxylate isomerase
MRPAVSRVVTSLITSRGARDLRRNAAGLRRRLSGAVPTVEYFHQADDPYSQLAAQLLGPLAARYGVRIRTWLVSPPDDAAAPERERLNAYALRDAPRVAAEYGLAWPDAGAAPEGVTGATLAAGDARRRKLGHYLGAMFHFEGEWYWGVDRLNHLEERLAGLGLDRSPGTAPIAPYRDMTLGPVPAHGGPAPVIEAWFSFRSPYSWIAFPRLRRLARRYGAKLELRFILPMVMRGLPVPPVKRMYITLDTKREAERVGLPYGCIVDPVGPGAARALAVLHHAIPLGRGEDFAELGMRAAFADGIALAEDAGLYDVARRSGLTDDQTTAALADESWRAAAEANRAALFEAGLWGAPTYRVGGGPAHWGQDRLWALEQDLVAAMGGASGAPEQRGKRR